MEYGYMNIAERAQARREREIERQRKILSGAQRIFIEKSGEKILNALLRTLKTGDVLRIAEMSAFGKTAMGVLFRAEQVVDTGAVLEICGVGEFSNEGDGLIRLEMLKSMAEFEKEVVVKEAGKSLNRGKLNPIKREMGRPRKDFWREDVKVLHKRQLRGELTEKEICEGLGISRGTWYNRVKENGLKGSI